MEQSKNFCIPVLMVRMLKPSVVITRKLKFAFSVIFRWPHTEL